MDFPNDAKTMMALFAGQSAEPSDGTLPEGHPWQESYALSLGQQAYIWGFPWIYLTQICWLWTSEGGKAVTEAQGLKLPWAPMNSFFYAPALGSPAAQTGGAPNCDTLYSTAWLNLAHEPLVLSVPAITDRYYTIQMASIDSDNFGYVGTRTTGTAAGDYLIAGPNWFGAVPANVLDVLPRSRTPVALLLGRTGVNNGSPEDLSLAQAAQQGFRLTPLSRWNNPALPVEPAPRAMVPVGLDFNNPRGAWETMNRAMGENPPGVYPAIDQTPLIRLFATIGVGPGQRLSAQSQATLRGLRAAATDGLALMNQMAKGRGKPVNGWTYPPLDFGRAGQASDYITRAALQALGGIVANDPAEAVYLNTVEDADGNPLVADGTYAMTFRPDGGYPPFVADFHGFWSVTLYTATFNLVPNSTHYTVNSHDPSAYPPADDGSLTILIQRQDPQITQKGIYWLQTPDAADTTGGEFLLILRIYVPGPEVSGSQTWVPPAVTARP